jgi:hypothetical protein
MKNVGFVGFKVLIAASLLAGTACTNDASRGPSPVASPSSQGPAGLPRSTQYGVPGTQIPSMLGTGTYGATASPDAAGPSGLPRSTQYGVPGTQIPSLLGTGTYGAVASPDAPGPAGVPGSPQRGVPGSQRPSMLGN